MAEGQMSEDEARKQLVEEYGLDYNAVAEAMRHAKVCDEFLVSLIIKSHVSRSARRLPDRMCRHFKKLPLAQPENKEDVLAKTFCVLGYDRDADKKNNQQIQRTLPPLPLNDKNSKPAPRNVTDISDNTIPKLPLTPKQPTAVSDSTTAGHLLPSPCSTAIPSNMSFGHAVPGLFASLPIAESEESSDFDVDTEHHVDDENDHDDGREDEEETLRKTRFEDISERKLGKLYTLLNFPCPMGHADWREVAHELKIDRHHITDWEARPKVHENPAKKTLDSWKYRTDATVGSLLDIFQRMNKEAWVIELNKIVCEHVAPTQA